MDSKGENMMSDVLKGGGEEEEEETAQLTGLSLFRWIETESKTAVPGDECLLVVNLDMSFKVGDNVDDDDNKPIKIKERLISNLKLTSLFWDHNRLLCWVTRLLSITLSCSPRNTIDYLARQVSNRILSCFRFHLPPSDTNSARPRHCFVADVSIIRLSNHCHHDHQPNRLVLVHNHNIYDIFFNLRSIHTAEFAALRMLRDHGFEMPMPKDVDIFDEDNLGELNEILSVLRSCYSALVYCCQHNKKPIMIISCDFQEMDLPVDEMNKKLIKIKPSMDVVEATQEEEGDHEFLVQSNDDDDDDDDDNLCSICFEIMSNHTDHIVKVLACNHVFHTQCLFNWLPNKQSCPCCRSIIATTNVYLDTKHIACEAPMATERTRWGPKPSSSIRNFTSTGVG